MSVWIYIYDVHTYIHTYLHMHKYRTFNLRNFNENRMRSNKWFLGMVCLCMCVWVSMCVCVYVCVCVHFNECCFRGGLCDNPGRVTSVPAHALLPEGARDKSTEHSRLEMLLIVGVGRGNIHCPQFVFTWVESDKKRKGILQGGLHMYRWVSQASNPNSKGLL